MWQNVIVVFIFIVLFCLRDMRKPAFFPPGPAWLPLIGCGHRVFQLVNVHRFFHLMWDTLARRYGPLVGLKLGRDRVVIVSGLAAIREFYSKEAFNGRPSGFFFRVRSFNKRLGLVFNDGEVWDVQRRFSLRTLKALGMGRTGMVNALEKETEEVIHHLRKISRGGRTVAMHSAFDIAVLNVIWTLLAGNRFKLDDKRLEWICDTIHNSFRVVDMSGGVLNQFPSVRHICPNKSGFKPLVALLKPLWEFLEETIKSIKATPDCPERINCFISSYLEELQKGDHHPSFSNEQLLCLCLDLFQAGSETTSNTLGFGVAYMMHHPKVVQKIHHELDTVIGRYRLPKLEDRPNLPYLEATICEIQRIANVAPLAIAHRTMAPVQLGQYVIPRDTIAMVSLYSIHMDKQYWGDPEVFRPERFLNDTGDKLIQHEYFMPFGAAFMHAFIVEPAEPDKQLPQLEGLDGITLSPQPYQVRLKERLI